MIKATTLDRRTGVESVPVSLEDNGNCYVLLPDRGNYDWRLYAPFRGCEATGPWYFWRRISRRDVKQAHRTFAINYQDADLVPLLSPDYEHLCSVCGESHSARHFYMGALLIPCTQLRSDEVWVH